MNKIKLSVIIPVYNATDTIRQTVDSVCSQGISNLEILCVDDGSTDASVEVLEALARQDSRIRIICQSNRSAGAARNNGLAHATGEFVHFLDADDLLCPGIYQNALNRLEKTDADVCIFQYQIFDNQTQKQIKYPCLLNSRERLTTLRQEPTFLLYNMVAPWNKVYRRAFLEDHTLRFDEIPCGNDRGFYFRMLAAGGKIALIMDYGVSYRVNNTASLTGSNRWKHFDSLFFAWDSSSKAMEGESAPIRAMLLDCVIRDILEVYRRTPKEHQAQVLSQLQDRFDRADLSIIQALPLPCVWQTDVELLRAGKNPCDAKRRFSDRLRDQVAACCIWGIRGRIVKLLSRI